MTAIVGIEDNGKVVMGSDSCASTDFDKISLDLSKVFTIPISPERAIMFGYCGSSRFEDIVTHHTQFRPQLEENESDREYLIKHVIFEIRRALLDNGLRSENDNSGQMGLLGYNGKLYYISPDFSLTRDPCGYAAIGSGQSVALGSLCTTANVLEFSGCTTTKILLALQSAERHARGVHAPFNIDELR